MAAKKKSTKKKTAKQKGAKKAAKKKGAKKKPKNRAPRSWSIYLDRNGIPDVDPHAYTGDTITWFNTDAGALDRKLIFLKKDWPFTQQVTNWTITVAAGDPLGSGPWQVAKCRKSPKNHDYSTDPPPPPMSAPGPGTPSVIVEG